MTDPQENTMQGTEKGERVTVTLDREEAEALGQETAPAKRGEVFANWYVARIHAREKIRAALDTPSEESSGEISARPKMPPYDRLLESLRWAFDYITAHHKPDIGDPDWSEWASAYDWLKDAAMAEGRELPDAEPEPSEESSLAPGVETFPRYADTSPGDVIAAEPDGTIMLDDGITTWNPERATRFLTAQLRRELKERDEMIASIQAESDENFGRAESAEQRLEQARKALKFEALPDRSEPPPGTVGEDPFDGLADRIWANGQLRPGARYSTDDLEDA